MSYKYRLILDFVLLDLCTDEKHFIYTFKYNTLEELNSFLNDIYLKNNIKFLRGLPWMVRSYKFERIK